MVGVPRIITEDANQSHRQCRQGRLQHSVAGGNCLQHLLAAHADQRWGHGAPPHVGMCVLRHDGLDQPRRAWSKNNLARVQWRLQSINIILLLRPPLRPSGHQPVQHVRDPRARCGSTFQTSWQRWRRTTLTTGLVRASGRTVPTQTLQIYTLNKKWRDFTLPHTIKYCIFSSTNYIYFCDMHNMYPNQ